MAAVQPTSTLCSFPAKIWKNIAFEVVCFEPRGSPTTVIPLLRTCKSMHNALAFNQCHDLYGRIFEIKFDIGAILRWKGFKSTDLAQVAMQLKKYCTSLQKIRHGDICSPEIHDILRTSLPMAAENDGKNTSELAWAGLDMFVDRFLAVMSRLCLLAESSLNAVALWLMWFPTTRGQSLSQLLYSKP